jgi:hypothetical protein
MPLSARERKAEWAKACALHEQNSTDAAREHIGVSWTQVRAALTGERSASLETEEKIAAFCLTTRKRMFGDRVRRPRGRPPRTAQVA